MRKIIVANQKGGVGKTTTIVNVGHGLAMKGRRVLIIDCDPQGQAATFLGLDQESGVFDLLISKAPLSKVTRPADSEYNQRPCLFIVPGDKRTATAQAVLVAESFNVACFTEALQGEEEKFDYILFDTSPSIGLLQEAAMFTSDWLIAPSAVDFASTQGLLSLVQTLQVVQRKGGQCGLFGVIPTMFDSITKESKAAMDELNGQLGDVVFPPIHRATILRECVARGTTIFEQDPRSRTAQEYQVIVEEILRNE